MTVLQAATPPDSHSLHITVSANQKNTWGDFMEKVYNYMDTSMPQHIGSVIVCSLFQQHCKEPLLKMLNSGQAYPPSILTILGLQTQIL